jgi:hypothetical protein
MVEKVKRNQRLMSKNKLDYGCSSNSRGRSKRKKIWQIRRKKIWQIRRRRKKKKKSN